MQFLDLAIRRAQSICFYECIGRPRTPFDMVEMLGGEVGWARMMGSGGQGL
jgi:hypothetical protein